MRSMVQGTQELQFGDYQSCCWELIAYVHKNRTSHIFGKTNSCGTHASVASRRSFLWFCHHVIRVRRENGRQLPLLRYGSAAVSARSGRRRDSSHLLVSVAPERDTSPLLLLVYGVFIFFVRPPAFQPQLVGYLRRSPHSSARDRETTRWLSLFEHSPSLQ